MIVNCLLMKKLEGATLRIHVHQNHCARPAKITRDVNGRYEGHKEEQACQTCTNLG